METLVNHQPYHTLLQEAFRARREKNSAYSLRAFARAIDISPTTLSKVFRYQRNLSKHNLTKLASFLELSPLEIDKLSDQIMRNNAKNRSVKERQMAEDEFHLISDWYYFAILSLARTAKCRADAHWVARHLGISPLEANTAISRLGRLGLIEKKKDRLVRTVESIRTTTDIPSAALRKLHKQQLHLASQALERIPVERRDITSITLAIDPARLALAKKKIGEFRDLLGSLLEGGEKKEVYLLSVQLFPLQDGGST